LVDNRHHIRFDYAPTSFEEGTRITIRARGFVICGIVHRRFNLFLRECLTKTRKITLQSQDCCPIKILGPWRASLDDFLEVTMDESLLLVMVRNSTIVIL
jgi:hypothetical protein